MEIKGLTGPIQFKKGRRTDFKLDLMKLKQHTLAKVGEWTPGIGVNITDMSAFHDTAPYNITLVVVTILVSKIFIFYTFIELFKIVYAIPYLLSFI